MTEGRKLCIWKPKCLLSVSICPTCTAPLVTMSSQSLFELRTRLLSAPAAFALTLSSSVDTNRAASFGNIGIDLLSCSYNVSLWYAAFPTYREHFKNSQWGQKYLPGNLRLWAANLLTAKQANFLVLLSGSEQRSMRRSIIWYLAWCKQWQEFVDNSVCKIL